MGCPSDKLIEECSELIKALCKAKRFGINTPHPDTGITAYQRIEEEMDDVMYAMRVFTEEVLMDESNT